MDYLFRFAHPWIVWIGLPILLACALWRWRYHRGVRYRYSLASLLKRSGAAAGAWRFRVINGLRLVSLFLLVFLCGKPQLVDRSSKVQVEGIDIMLVLDVSGSMQLFDDLHDRRQRIEVAKTEAVRFVQKRENDPIGLVLFAHEAISRCPLTLDKNVLTQIIQETNLGIINPNGTALSIGISTAANRLKTSHAKSKIMIVLTDGEPTPHDLDPEIALSLAKKLGIKIYTIGIGGEHGGLIDSGAFGVQRMGQSALNKPLLEHIAQQTGGQFFEAKQPRDIQRIYDIIDQLEKTEYETDVFTRYYDLFLPFLWLVMLMVLLEMLFATCVWYRL